MTKTKTIPGLVLLKAGYINKFKQFLNSRNAYIFKIIQSGIKNGNAEFRTEVLLSVLRKYFLGRGTLKLTAVV